MVQKVAIVDSVTSALSGQDATPATDLEEANLRVDSWGNLHALLHMESAASTPEPLQSNRDITVLASAARTAAVDSSDFTNVNHRGVVVTVDVTADPSTAAVTFTIQGKDVESSSYYTLLASAALATVDITTDLVVYPGCIAVANRVANLPLPRIWRVSVTVADAESFTYSVGASLVV
ncbi:hypothetical protein LCGC14_0397370 [marine sediment metagenome]|uniref:Uncharacterized protein n=1 Tax=marine sediment metagenome TaxID=412755 RepID=A0A0F9T3P6_9ZZZZ